MQFYTKLYRCFVVVAIISSSIIFADVLPTQTVPIPLFHKSSNQFAVDVYSQIRSQHDGNIFFSPTSMYTALMMLLSGGEGTTKASIESVLHRPHDESIKEAFKAELKNLDRINNKNEIDLQIANALFKSITISINDSYLNDLSTYFDSEVLDEWTLSSVNDWVSKKTDGMITQLLDSLPDDPAALILSAIYFKGIWTYEFKESDTKNKRFHLNKENFINPQTMHMLANYNYLIDDDIQMINIPYDDETVVMTIILPIKRYTLTQVEDKLTSEYLTRMLYDLDAITDLTHIELHLPKFKSSFTAKLIPLLSNLGMKAALSLDADYSRMSSGPVTVDSIIHKALIDINEQGTKATAVTAIKAIGRSLASRPLPVKFFVNQPFIYLIRDKTTGYIIFMGRMTNPDVKESTFQSVNETAQTPGIMPQTVSTPPNGSNEASTQHPTATKPTHTNSQSVNETAQTSSMMPQTVSTPPKSNHRENIGNGSNEASTQYPTANKNSKQEINKTKLEYHNVGRFMNSEQLSEDIPIQEANNGGSTSLKSQYHTVLLIPLIIPILKWALQN